MKLLVVGCVALSSIGYVKAQVPSGPEVGAVIPAFELPDQNGHKQTLSSVAGPKGTLLVFFRSADW